MTCAQQFGAEVTECCSRPIPGSGNYTCCKPGECFYSPTTNNCCPKKLQCGKAGCCNEDEICFIDKCVSCDTSAGIPMFVCGKKCCKQDIEYCCDRIFTRNAPSCCNIQDKLKANCKDQEVAMMILAAAAGVAAFALTGGLAILVVLAASVGTASAVRGIAAKICGDDPPDPKYKELFLPSVPKVAAVKAGNGISAAAAKALNRMIENRLRSGAYTIAWIRSIEKAQGADQGGDKTWAKRHRRAAAGYAREAATTLERDKSLSNAALRELKKAGFVDTGVSLAQVRKWQQRVRQQGLPGETARVLGAAGVGDARVAAFRTAVSKLDPKLVAGVGIFGDLTDPRLAGANAEMIKALRRSASTLSKA